MPIEEYRAHDYLLGGLAQINSIYSIKLVARLYNPRIGNPLTDRLYIFFPDMHLIDRQRRKEKDWRGFNHERMFVDVVKKLVELRHMPSGIAFHTAQLGDFIDTWRIKGDEPQGVLEDFGGITWSLFRGGTNSLNTKFVIGNHDARLAGKPLLSSRAYMRLFFPLTPEPKVYCTHGDLFSSIEALPDDLQEFFVYHTTGTFIEDLFHKLSGDKRDKVLKNLVKIREKTCRKTDDFTTMDIDTPQPMLFTRDLADEINIKADHQFLEPCRDWVQKINTERNFKLNAAIIGHTHKAGITVDNNGFTIMDCGAWVGDYQANGRSIPCCQMGVVCGNDFRIYQLDPDEDISKRYEDATIY